MKIGGVKLFDLLLANKFGGSGAVLSLLRPGQDARDLEQDQRLFDQRLGQEAELLKPSLSQFGGPTAKQLGSAALSSNPTIADNAGNDIKALQDMQRSGALGNVRQLTQDDSIATVTRTPAAGFQSELGMARLGTAGRANLALATAQQKLAIATAERGVIAGEVDNRQKLQTVVQNNEAISAGVNGIRRYRQLLATLDDPNASMLDWAQAAVLVTQVIEPGLATRTDDRLAFKEGASPGLRNTVNAMNQLIGGEIDIATGKEVVKQHVRNLMEPLAGGTQTALEFWRSKAAQTPGTLAGDVNQVLGLTPEDLQTLDDLGLRQIDDE